MADGKREGCHWALLFVDLERCQSYYGDSLGWPLPTNLEEMVKPNIKEIEKVLHVDLRNSVRNITALHKTTKQKHRCSSCDFYPLQTCSTVCGVVTMAMAAVTISNTGQDYLCHMDSMSGCYTLLNTQINCE